MNRFFAVGRRTFSAVADSTGNVFKSRETESKHAAGMALKNVSIPSCIALIQFLKMDRSIFLRTFRSLHLHFMRLIFFFFYDF